MPTTGTLFLIPSVIADDTHHLVIPPQVKTELAGIHHFLAENIRTARRYLSTLKIYDSIEELHFEVLNKDTSAEAMKNLFMPLHEGKHLGIISESGCPGIADPGSLAVQYAHQNKIRVVPLVGPSSIPLALMASGLNGQRFAFHGYLPIDVQEAAHVLRDLEKESGARQQTQIFIETPYRNGKIFQQLVRTLRPDTRLCVALDLTGPGEYIRTLPVASWRSEDLALPKLPAIFLFLA